MTARPLTEIVEAGWAQALAPVAGTIAAAGDWLRAEVAAGRRYLPAGNLILRAFTQPFDDVRVLRNSARPAGPRIGRLRRWWRRTRRTR